MSPPGKKYGLMTKESVEKASEASQADIEGTAGSDEATVADPDQAASDEEGAVTEEVETLQKRSEP